MGYDSDAKSWVYNDWEGNDKSPSGNNNANTIVEEIVGDNYLDGPVGYERQDFQIHFEAGDRGEVIWIENRDWNWSKDWAPTLTNGDDEDTTSNEIEITGIQVSPDTS